MSDFDDSDDEDDGLLTSLTVFAVLGAGFLGLFAGVDWFWMIWVFGFAVVLPVVAILESRFGRILGDDPFAPADRGRSWVDKEEEPSAEDALETLKRRYAEGKIDEIEFEERVERLIENESIENVEERLEWERQRSNRGERERERSYEFE